MACLQAIEHVKARYADFSEVVEKIQQKYNIFL